MSPRSIEDYQVGWVCALPQELTAARAMLDEEHEPFKNNTAKDDNSYVLGRMGEHNVVLACLPAGVYGTNAAVIVAANMLRTFTGLRFGVLVGIGGGIPNLEKEVDIRLGDVVVSQPDKTHGGVVQYDVWKNVREGNSEQKGFLRPPPTLLLTALATLQSKHDLDGSQMPEFLAEMIKRRPYLAKSGYMYPGSEKDCLCCSHCKNFTGIDLCPRCEDGIIRREPRDNQHPIVHYGLVASGNQLIKNADERDRLCEELGAKCIEMEAAGLMNEFPCIVIRGICNYVDACKNDVWKKYAATTAAAFAKELLSVVRPIEVAVAKHASALMSEQGLPLYLQKPLVHKSNQVAPTSTIVLAGSAPLDPPPRFLRNDYTLASICPMEIKSAAYSHQAGSTCKNCDPETMVGLSDCSETGSQTQYRAVSSGTVTIEDVDSRDQLQEADSKKRFCCPKHKYIGRNHFSRSFQRCHGFKSPRKEPKVPAYCATCEKNVDVSHWARHVKTVAHQRRAHSNDLFSHGDLATSPGKALEPE